MNIKEFRQKYPQYADVSDGDLAQSMHKKFYADMPYEKFEASFIGHSPIKLGAEALPGSVKAEAASRSIPAQFVAGAGTALDNAAIRAKQLFSGGDLSQEDQLRVQSNRALADTPAGLTGAVAGNVGMLAVPGMGVQNALTQGAARVVPLALARTAGAAGAGGAVAAATNPVLQGESELTNAGIGAAGGAVGDAIPRVLGRAVHPIRQSAPVRALLDEGIVPTPGQAAGGMVNRIENAIESLPVVGQIIKAAKNRAGDELNLAALRRANPQVAAIGRRGLEQADDLISRGYDDVLSRTNVRVDHALRQSLQNVPANGHLTQEMERELGRVIQGRILARIPGGGVVPGELAKQIDSELGTIARSYGKSQDGAQVAFANTVRDLQTIWRGALANGASPADAAALRNLNGQFANMLRVERAMGSTAAREGVFSPAQLQMSVRALDPSRNHRQFAQGRALMQDLSDPAKQVLGDVVPDSGTAGRFLTSAAVTGAGADALFGSPGYLTALAASPLLYSRAGSRYMLGDLIPGQARAASLLLRSAPLSAQVGRATGTNY